MKDWEKENHELEVSRNQLTKNLNLIHQKSKQLDNTWKILKQVEAFQPQWLSEFYNYKKTEQLAEMNEKAEIINNFHRLETDNDYRVKFDKIARINKQKQLQRKIQMKIKNY